MSEFQNYMLAIAEKEVANQKVCYAGQLLENKIILCRLAEIKSQAEPLSTIMGGNDTLIEKLIAACEYVVNGKKPT